MKPAALLLLVAACGRIGFDASASGPADAHADSPPADACTLGPWGTPRALTTINSASHEYGPVISNDGLRIYFDSDRSGDEDIYGAFRISTSDNFGGASPLPVINTVTFEGDATWTADELDMVFARGGAPACLYETTRGAIGDNWREPVRIDNTCTTDDAGGGALSADGLHLYFNDQRDSLGEGVMFVLARASRTSPWGTAAAVDGLDGTPKGYPGISGDELTLYYEEQTTSGLSIYQVERPTTDAAFGPPMRPPGFPDMANDADPSVTSDGHAMVFASSRTGLEDIYLVTRSCQ